MERGKILQGFMIVDMDLSLAGFQDWGRPVDTAGIELKKNLS